MVQQSCLVRLTFRNRILTKDLRKFLWKQVIHVLRSSAGRVANWKSECLGWGIFPGNVRVEMSGANCPKGKCLREIVRVGNVLGNSLGESSEWVSGDVRRKRLGGIIRGMFGELSSGNDWGNVRGWIVQRKSQGECPEGIVRECLGNCPAGMSGGMSGYELSGVRNVPWEILRMEGMSGNICEEIIWWKCPETSHGTPCRIISLYV